MRAHWLTDLRGKLEIVYGSNLFWQRGKVGESIKYGGCQKLEDKLKHFASCIFWGEGVAGGGGREINFDLEASSRRKFVWGSQSTVAITIRSEVENWNQKTVFELGLRSSLPSPLRLAMWITPPSIHRNVWRHLEGVVRGGPWRKYFFEKALCSFESEECWCREQISGADFFLAKLEKNEEEKEEFDDDEKKVFKKKKQRSSRGL